MEIMLHMFKLYIIYFPSMLYRHMKRNLINNRFVITNTNAHGHHLGMDHTHKKCANNIYSYGYADNVIRHDELMEESQLILTDVDMTSIIDIKIAFHFMSPNGSFNKSRVLSRTNDVIASLNDDFNNYSSNPNTMNNFKYKSIINQVFLSNMVKQNIYLGEDFIEAIPASPSNIIFSLGEIYYYPLR